MHPTASSGSLTGAPPSQSAPPAALRVALALSLAALGGCADLTYERVRLGLAPSEYDRVLDTQRSSWTEAGLVEYQRDDDGDASALLLLLADDRRIAGKIQVRRAESELDLPLARRGYELRGELDPRLYGLGEVGPIDSLRLLTQRLCEFPTERTSRTAHLLAAAGLMRILERQPGVEDIGLSGDQRRELALYAPAEGVPSLSLDSDGILRFSFAHGQVR
jgi:hypothetical protein